MMREPKPNTLGNQSDGFTHGGAAGESTRSGRTLADRPVPYAGWGQTRSSDSFALLISAPASAAATATPEVSFLHRPRFIDGEVTSADFFAIELRDCFLRSGVVGHLYKSEAFRASGIAICDDLNGFNLTNFAEHVTQIGFRGLKRQISNVDFFCHPSSIRAALEFNRQFVLLSHAHKDYADHVDFTDSFLD